MTCDCETLTKQDVINFICEEIQASGTKDPWITYLNFIADHFKTASIRWTFTRTNSEKWFRRVLKNMTKEELIFWGHKEHICVDQITKCIIEIKD